MVEIVRVGDHLCSITGKHREALIVLPSENQRRDGILGFVEDAAGLRRVRSAKWTSDTR